LKVSFILPPQRKKGRKERGVRSQIRDGRERKSRFVDLPSDEVEERKE
jgi:hypothetical protein